MRVRIPLRAPGSQSDLYYTKFGCAPNVYGLNVEGRILNIWMTGSELLRDELQVSRERVPIFSEYASNIRKCALNVCGMRSEYVEDVLRICRGCAPNDEGLRAIVREGFENVRALMI